MKGLDPVMPGGGGCILQALTAQHSALRWNDEGAQERKP